MPTLPPPPRSAPPEPKSGLLANGDGTYRWEGLAFVALVDEDGTVHFVDREEHFQWATWTLAFGGGGQDTGYREKNEAMEVTFQDPVRLRAQEESIRMRAALDALPVYLFTVWRQQKWPPQLRRRILFELWDECAEMGEAFRVAGGRAAREAIEDFVRKFLPENSAWGYTRAELAALNRHRESRRAFTPYQIGVMPFTRGSGRYSPTLRADAVPELKY